MEWDNDVSIQKQVKRGAGELEDCVALRDFKDYARKTGSHKRDMNDVKNLIKWHRVSTSLHA
jgi:hypothetical protein